MTDPPRRPVTPRERIEASCALVGQDAVVDACLALLSGSEDLELVRLVANQGADKYADGRVHEDTYWFRVWAMRGLLWAWDPRATAAVRAGFADEAWRVRELAAKVVARHGVEEAFAEVVAARGDPVPRVRAAAERALTVVARG